MQPIPLDDVPRLAALLSAEWSNLRLGPKARRNALCVAAMLLGLRCTEIRSLRPTHISVATNTLRMKRAKKGRTVTITTPATWAENAIRVWRDMHAWHHGTRWLFTMHDGRQIDRRELYKWCASRTRRATGTIASPHDLRHTAALVCWQQTHDVAAVQQLLGHVHLRSTVAYLQTITPTSHEDAITWSLSKHHLHLYDPDHQQKGRSA